MAFLKATMVSGRDKKEIYVNTDHIDVLEYKEEADAFVFQTIPPHRKVIYIEPDLWKKFLGREI